MALLIAMSDKAALISWRRRRKRARVLLNDARRDLLGYFLLISRRLSELGFIWISKKAALDQHSG
jgi:hypothetical protein